MSFADDLLDQAYHLLNKDGNSPMQASLRRSVSTAYYALFHLLIDEAVGNWSVVHQRNRLARTFEHGSMKRVCDDRVKAFYGAGQPAADLQLKEVAESFSLLQAERHRADYDNSYSWTKVTAEDWLQTATAAFDTWRAIRLQTESLDFLLQLFLPKLPRQ